MAPRHVPLLLAAAGLLAAVHCGGSPASALRHLAVLLAIAHVLHLPRQARFIQWFARHTARESLCAKVGLTSYGYRLLRLSDSALQNVYAALQTALVMMAVMPFDGLRRAAAAAAAALATLYYGQLWSGGSVRSWHSVYFALTALVYAAVAPNAVTAVTLLRWHMASVYAASVLQKLMFSLLERRPWWRCLPHTFIWRAMVSRPWFPQTQHFFFVRPRLTAAAGLAALVAELLPLAYCLGWLAPAGAAAPWLGWLPTFALHVAVYVLQGIDYLSLLAPVALLCGAAAGGAGAALPWPTPLAQIAQEDLRLTALAMLSCAAQLLLYALLPGENCSGGEAPPFMSHPIFVSLARLDDRTPQTLVLMDGDAPVPYEHLEWIYPYFYISDIDAVRDPPCRFLTFGCALVARDLMALTGARIFYVGLKPNGPGDVDDNANLFVLTNLDIDANAEARAVADAGRRLLQDLSNPAYKPYARLHELSAQRDVLVAAFRRALETDAKRSACAP